MLRCESCFEISRGGDGVMRMVLGGRLAVWNWGDGGTLRASLFFGRKSLFSSWAPVPDVHGTALSPFLFERKSLKTLMAAV